MKTLRNITSIAIIFLAISCKDQPKESPKELPKEIFDLVLSNAQVIDIESGAITKQTLYIRKGVIVKITPEFKKDFNTFKHIEADRVYVLPGFWDNHVHFRGGEELIAQNEKFLEEYINYGITTVRDAGGDLTPQVQQWNQEVYCCTRTGPTIYTSGPKLDGPNARWAGSLPVSTAEDITTALDSLQALDTDYVKLYDSTLSRKQYLDIITAAETRDMITSGHMPFTVELQEAIDAGLDNIEHLYYVLKGCSSNEKEITQQIIDGTLGFWGSMEQLIATYDETIAQQTFARLKANNVFVTPTLHIGDVLSYLDEVDHSQDAYLKCLEVAFTKTYEGRIKGVMNASAKAKKDRKELQQFFIILTKSLHDAGVSLLAGSDAGAYNSYTYPGPSLHGELAQMVEAGLTPLQALQTSGYNGSKFLKKKGYGIAVGNRADLVILSKNPLEDIRNTQSIRHTIKNGNLHTVDDNQVE
ncbi:amidohydrolase family protein [Dokdonia sp.]|uniref:amidohydrolase family protein n=1 Tax=Dokdonia sp. TaxID=2024995 RepID=UPI003267D17D